MLKLILISQDMWVGKLFDVSVKKILLKFMSLQIILPR